MPQSTDRGLGAAGAWEHAPMTTGTMRMIVDGDGSVWSAYDEKLIERWGYPDPDFDLTSFAVRNLGAIDVHVEQAQTTVTFRWQTVKTEALSAAIELLGRLPPRDILVRSETEAWNDQRFATPSDVAEWVKINCALMRIGVSRNLLSKPRQLDLLGEMRLNNVETNEERLGLVFKKWRLSQGRFDIETTNFLVRFGLIDRAVIVNEVGSGDLFFSHAGSKLNLYDHHDQGWTFGLVGARVEDQPDPEYGRWVAGTYRNVLSENRPRFEYVDVVVQPPGSDTYRSRYDRLLLPWSTPGGERVVSAVSFKTPVMMSA